MTALRVVIGIIGGIVAGASLVLAGLFAMADQLTKIDHPNLSFRERREIRKDKGK